MQISNKCSAVAEMGDRSDTIDMGRKLGLYQFFGGGSQVPPHNMAWAEAYLHTKWHPNPSSRLTTIVMGQNWDGAVPPVCCGVGSPSNTMWLWPRPTAMPSFILIHPTV